MEQGYSSDLAAGLASTLEWWTEAGVDCVVADEPRAWLAEPQILPGTGRWQAEGLTEGANLLPKPELGGGPPPPLAVGERSPSPFRGGSDNSLPNQLDLFQEWLRASTTLPYATPGAPRVCPAGDPAAGLMILTAMPSADDCTDGVLVSGAPGRLFDRMLAAIGRSRDTIYLAGLSCLRPVGGRFDRDGAERCAGIARHHIGLAAPRAVLLVGDACAKALLGLGATQARGRVHTIDAGGHSVSAIVTLSPEFLLSQPAAKALAWADLQLLMATMK